MTLDEMKEKASAGIASTNLNSTKVEVARVHENFIDGTLITVSFQDNTGKAFAHYVHFGRNGVRTYKWYNDVLNAVSTHRERLWFFRFLEYAGMGGLIAFVLVVVFSVLLCVLALTNKNANPSVVEVVKLSFTIILGYFFGSQTAGKK